MQELEKSIFFKIKRFVFSAFVNSTAFISIVIGYEISINPLLHSRRMGSEGSAEQQKL